MKIVRRIIVFLFVLVCAFFAFANLNKASADTVTTSSEIQVLGAGVRTAGNAGIRFVGSVGLYDTTYVKAYGIAIAFGEVDASDILLGETIGGKSVLTATDTELDGEGYFYIVLYGVPEASYTQDVTARAYVILNDDSVVYSTTATTRNLAEVAIKAKNDGFSGGLIDTVVASDAVSTGFKKVVRLYNGSYLIGNPRYEYDIDVIASEFLNDYNTVMGTSYASLIGWAKLIMGAYGGTDTEEQVKADKLYLFFTANDGEMLTKWQWLLDTLVTISGNDFVTYQVGIIKGTHSTWANWWGSRHLLSRMEGFLTKTRCTTTSFYSDFYNQTYRNYYDYLTNSTLPSSSYVGVTEIGKTFELDDNLTPRTGYVYNGYKKGLTAYAVGDDYTVTSTTEVVTQKEETVNYTITFYDVLGDAAPVASGQANINYNVETATFDLPSGSVANYSFINWYDNASCTGDPITSITKGTTGNKTLYGKYQYGFTLSLDLDGGNFKYNTQEEAIADFLSDYNAYSNESFAVTSHTASTFSNIGPWNEIGKSTYFLYANMSKWGWLIDYIATKASSANRPAYNNIKNYNNYSSFNSANSNYIYAIAYELRGWVGQIYYTRNSNFKTADYSSASIKNSFMPYLVSLDATASVRGIAGNICLEDTILSIPKKNGYSFAGWYYEDADETYDYDEVVNFDKDMNFKALYTPINYTLSYDLQGGSSTASTSDVVFTIESAAITLPASGTMSKATYNFVEWNTRADGTGSSLSSIATGSYGNITAYAIWVSNVVELSSNDTAAIIALSPDIFVSSAFTNGSFTINGSTYDVGEELFSTLSTAISAATAGQKIYVFAGIYSEALTINKTLLIAGPNYNIAGNGLGRSSEAIIDGAVTVSANGVEINGFNTTKQILLSNGVNGFDYINNVSSVNASGSCVVFSAAASSVSNVNVSNNKATSFIGSRWIRFGTIQNLTVSNNYLVSTGATYDYIYVDTCLYGTNSFTNNYFENSAQSVFNIQHVGGMTLLVKDNYFKNITSTVVDTRGMVAAHYGNVTINIIHNTFEQSSNYAWRCIRPRNTDYSTYTLDVQVHYNKFLANAYTMSGGYISYANNPGSGTIYNMDHNYFADVSASAVSNNNFGGQASSWAGCFDSVEALETAYAAFLE